MKLLLDENTPRKLKTDLSEFEVFTVREMGWGGKENGDLLDLMLKNNFDALTNDSMNDLTVGKVV